MNKPDPVDFDNFKDYAAAWVAWCEEDENVALELFPAEHIRMQLEQNWYRSHFLLLSEQRDHLESILREIRESGNNEHPTSQWMQHMAAHALEPGTIPKPDTYCAEEDLTVCPKCRGQLRPGKATGQTLSSGLPDLGGDIVTMSPGGPGTLIDCMKCPSCGWSRTKSKNDGM